MCSLSLITQTHTETSLQAQHMPYAILSIRLSFNLKPSNVIQMIKTTQLILKKK